MKKLKKIRIGIIGCGNISDAYFTGLRLFPNLVEIVACGDIDPERARAKAADKNVPKGGTVQSVLKDPHIDLIVNLTVPKAHAKVNLAALKAGKHVYCEKPFALNLKEGKKVVALAKKKKLLVGTAPDTFLGSALQTCRKLVDDGEVGKIVAATAFMVCPGHEAWHPNPGFYYEKGGGPLFDMGPYYLTALVTLLGPVKRVCASAKISFPTRKITSKPQFGKIIRVETPTHLSGTLDFESGAVATIVMSFDVIAAKLPRLELYGTEATLECPDPNMFHEEKSIAIRRKGKGEWENVPLVHPHRVGRGMGVADMAKAILKGGTNRCSGELGCHIVEVMQAFEASSKSGRFIKLKTTCRRPKALPAGLKTGEI